MIVSHCLRTNQARRKKKLKQAMQTTRDIVKEKSIEKQKKGKDQIETSKHDKKNSAER